MRQQVGLAVALAFTVTGCASSDDIPMLGAPPARAVIALSDVVNNIKCDMLKFMRDNEIVTERGSIIGGTLKFTVDRSRETGGGLALGIPIFTGVKLGGSFKKSRASSFGEVVSTPFVMTFDKNDAPVPCAPNTRVEVTNRLGKVSHPVLRAPLLELGALRDALNHIAKGQPKILFADFNFKGSVILTRKTDTSANIDAVWIKPEVSNKVASDFKIEYDIGTNWQKILTDAGYEVEVASTKPQLVEDAAVKTVRLSKHGHVAVAKPKPMPVAGKPLYPITNPVTGALSVPFDIPTVDNLPDDGLVLPALIPPKPVAPRPKR